MGAAAETAGALEVFRAVGLAYVRFACDHPGHYRAMFHPRLAERGERPALPAAGDAAFAVLVDAVEACQGAGDVRAGDPRELALAAWAGAHGIATLWSDGMLGEHAALGFEELARRWTTTLYHGLRP